VPRTVPQAEEEEERLADGADEAGAPGPGPDRGVPQPDRARAGQAPCRGCRAHPPVFGAGDGQGVPFAAAVEDLPERPSSWIRPRSMTTARVAEGLCLPEVVGRQQQRDPARLELLEPLHVLPARVSVEAAGRLVEDDDPRVAEECPGQHQPPAHAGGEGRDRSAGVLLEPGGAQLAEARRAGRRPVDAVVAGVEEQVLQDAEIGVEQVLLRGDAEEGLDPPRLAGDVQAVDADRAGGRPERAVDHLQGRRLPGAVRPEQAQAAPAGNAEADRVDDPGGAEGLRDRLEDDGRVARAIGHGRGPVQQARDLAQRLRDPRAGAVEEDDVVVRAVEDPAGAHGRERVPPRTLRQADLVLEGVVDEDHVGVGGEDLGRFHGKYAAAFPAKTFRPPARRTMSSMNDPGPTA